MSLIAETLWEVVGSAVTTFLFLTGEVLVWAFTLGRHRVRWWELQDVNVTWPLTLLGTAFWLGLARWLSS